VVMAATSPEYPELHAQPLGTLMPLLFGGQRTAVQVKVVGKNCELPEHVGMLLDVGAKPGLHVGRAMVPDDTLPVHWPPELPEELEEEEEEEEEGAKQLPRLSANMPRELHAAIAASWAVKADTLAVLLLTTASDACVCTRVLCVALSAACVCVSVPCTVTRFPWATASATARDCSTADARSCSELSAACARLRSIKTLAERLVSAAVARVASEEMLEAIEPSTPMARSCSVDSAAVARRRSAFTLVAMLDSEESALVCSEEIENEMLVSDEMARARSPAREDARLPSTPRARSCSDPTELETELMALVSEDETASIRALVAFSWAKAVVI